MGSGELRCGSLVRQPEVWRSESVEIDRDRPTRPTRICQDGVCAVFRMTLVALRDGRKHERARRQRQMGEASSQLPGSRSRAAMHPYRRHARLAGDGFGRMPYDCSGIACPALLFSARGMQRVPCLDCTRRQRRIHKANTHFPMAVYACYGGYRYSIAAYTIPVNMIGRPVAVQFLCGELLDVGDTCRVSHVSVNACCLV